MVKVRMQTLAHSSLFSLLLMPFTLLAAETAVPTTGMSILKMFLGLAVVLVVMALFAWGAKKMLPGLGAQASAVKMVGGISVGTRERVVVLEIAGRWIVVGVGGGQVNAIANLEPGMSLPDDASATWQTALDNPLSPFTQTFTHWLSQAMHKKPSEK